jgi:hypothetical protein
MTDEKIQMFAGEFIMAGQGVPVSEAAMQFFVEAMRANTTVLETVQRAMVGIQEEQKETLRQVVDVRERVIRIEALPQFGVELNELRKDVNDIKMKQVQVDAKAQTWTWIVRYVPTLAGIIVTIIASVFIVLVASGRLVVPAPDNHPRALSAPPSPDQASRR